MDWDIVASKKQGGGNESFLCSSQKLQSPGTSTGIEELPDLSSPDLDAVSHASF